MTERIVEVMADAVYDPTRSMGHGQKVASARRQLAALEAAGYAIFRPGDCMETRACAHCVTAAIPLEHRMEEFYLVPVGGEC